MTAVQLIKNAEHPFEIIVTGDTRSLNTGVAYNPYSKKQLLNVVASRMSAFEDQPDDFIDWAAASGEFPGIERGLLANAYLPRYLYGRYLKNIWEEALQQALTRNIRVTVKAALVLDMEVGHQEVILSLDNGERVVAQYCIFASGNNLPGNPVIENPQFFSSPHYFRNPWDASSVSHPDADAPVLILGNGLTMVDTVIGLTENGFTNKICTLSRHGFIILPHRHPGIGYPAVVAELQGKQSLPEIVRVVGKHIKIARKLGFTAEPVIDALRTLSPQLWQNLVYREKYLFMTRLRYLWDSARHRIPMHIHDRIGQLRDAGKLDIYTGKLLNITETEKGCRVRFFDRIQKTEKEILVSAVINCTGPETDIMKQDAPLLINCLKRGIAVQDELKSGIMADPETFEVYNGQHERQRNIFAMGSLLKGVLGESTAVRELRVQAEKLSKRLIHKMNE